QGWPMVDPRMGGAQAPGRARRLAGALTIAASLGLATACLLSLGACQRRTQLFTDSDSTRVAPPDSARAWRERALQLWDDPDQRDAASELTARVLRDEFLRLEAPAWQERARFVLDSLGIGAE